ncbi:stress response protein NST1-like isoform X2 [Miscanthus floridulus]|uniref:stress response protein NST1-like isoform X2 n=1 Tax=Miscanthus floridulus TaxID=154761 RepID=UPI00345AF197
MGSSEADEDQLLKSFLAEVSEAERDNEVLRILGCFKLNPFEHLKLSFDSSLDEVKKQYRKLSLLVHPDKCKHPQAQEAFAALAKAQQLLLDPQERGYILDQVTAAKEELRAKRKKELKKDSASKIKSLVDEGKYEEQFERSDEFQKQLIIKVREILTEKEWRRRKMQMRISEEEGRLKKDEEETKEMWKRKREHEEKWEETRDQRPPIHLYIAGTTAAFSAEVTTSPCSACLRRSSAAPSRRRSAASSTLSTPSSPTTTSPARSCQRSEITRLTNLTLLKLYNHSLCGALPAGFGRLTKLQYFVRRVPEQPHWHPRRAPVPHTARVAAVLQRLQWRGAPRVRRVQGARQPVPLQQKPHRRAAAQPRQAPRGPPRHGCHGQQPQFDLRAMADEILQDVYTYRFWRPGMELAVKHVRRKDGAGAPPRHCRRRGRCWWRWPRRRGGMRSGEAASRAGRGDMARRRRGLE